LTARRNREMHNIDGRSTVFSALLGTALLFQACGKSLPSTNREHIRGAIQNLDGQVLTVATSAGSVHVRLEPSTRVATVVQSDRAHITDGSFLGITSVTESDGSRRAVEVHIFPEAMRGTGEGSYGWDWPGASRNTKMTNGTASKMTNGTVSKSKMTNGTATTQVGGSSLTVQYKDGASGGSQTIKIPPGVPVFAIEPGQSRDLQPGVHIFVVATRDTAGLLTADRVLAGKNGVIPPM
jgi:hypothetical protein